MRRHRRPGGNRQRRQNPTSTPGSIDGPYYRVAPTDSKGQRRRPTTDDIMKTRQRIDLKSINRAALARVPDLTRWLPDAEFQRLIVEGRAA